jgi:hypothetical protein
MINILQACDDRKVFAPFLRGATWDTWRVFLAVLFGLPLTPEQLVLYTKYTGRTTAPTTALNEAWLVCGRRSGKSFILALTAVFLACFRDWRPRLGPGEVGTVMIIARDRRQARVIKRFITGLLRGTPMLRQVIEGETQETIELRNNVSIEIHTASFRSTRGYTIIAALLDEVAYWPVDERSSEPDFEIINAVKPGMATIPGAMLLCASSPHARRGALWTAYRKHHGVDGDPVLVWRAPTREMNPTVPQSFIDAHMDEDPARAGAEYLAEFRTDLEPFVQREVIEACTGGFVELAPASNTRYFGFVDAAGGSGGDSFTAAISHREDNRVIVDCLRERRPPFSPSAVIEELVPLFESYRISRITGDRWAGGFPPEQFQQHHIKYEACVKVKSDLYVDLLPLLNSGRILLPRHPRLAAQLISLERTTVRGSGHDRIDAPRDQHDDLANAVAGAAMLAKKLAYDSNYTAWDDAPMPGPLTTGRRDFYGMRYIS